MNGETPSHTPPKPTSPAASHIFPIVIMDEPTRGIDVGAKREIHALLRQLAESGVGVIVVSSELPEVIGVSDRVAVMHEGCLAGFLEGEEVTEENIMKLASGEQLAEKELRQ